MIAATGNICTSETARDDRKPTADFTYNVSEQQMHNPNVALMKDGQYLVGQITAVDVATGNTVWQYQQRAYNYSAVLATAGACVQWRRRPVLLRSRCRNREEGLASPAGLHVLRLSGHLLGGRASVYSRRGWLWPQQPGSGNR